MIYDLLWSSQKDMGAWLPRISNSRLKCDWVESNNGIKIDKLGFTCVNLSKVGHEDDPFILASQANQVFYVDDPMERGWSIAF